MLKFPDDTQFSVFGLDEVLADLYREGRKADDETAEEIIIRLEEMKNYIPSSERARRDYRYLLLREYRQYVKERSEKRGSNV
jgi:hypothetical protein